MTQLTLGYGWHQPPTIFPERPFPVTEGELLYLFLSLLLIYFVC